MQSLHGGPSLQTNAGNDVLSRLATGKRVVSSEAGTVRQLSQLATAPKRAGRLLYPLDGLRMARVTRTAYIAGVDPLGRRSEKRAAVFPM